jgi:hypothetical protein
MSGEFMCEKCNKWLAQSKFGLCLSCAQEIEEEQNQEMAIALAIHLFALAVSKPHPVNAEPQDYEAIAKECVAKAQETASYLVKELSNE